MTDWFGPEEWQAVRLSLRVALVATLATLPVAYGLAHLLARRDFVGKSALNIAVHLPLVLPPVVTGYGLLLLFGPTAPLGRALEAIGLPLAFRWTGAALAAGIMALPLMVRAMRLAIETVDARLEAAAATLGAPPARVFVTITLPLAAPGVLAGAVLGFAKAIGEFGATITFVSNIPGETRTLPSAVYTFLQVPGGDASALRLAAVAVAIAALALVLSEVWAARALRKVRGQ
ncbi:MAG: molybdate ABC transporter permease subunit [Paracoccaceae bacterium]|nr:molybdate ABC transporter permease subunit [Paracoccaceae bacterium]